MRHETEAALEAAHATAREELGDLLQQRRELDDRIIELRELIGSLAAQLGLGSALAEDLMGRHARPHETRVAAVLRVVETASRSVSPTDVQRELADEGRRETVKAVASALSYLSGRGEVRSVRRGQWRAA